MEYHSTISIYGFGIYNEPKKAAETVLIKSGSMENAKRRANKRAKKLGFVPAEKHWRHDTPNYATREYLTDTQARRLIVVERS